QGEAGIDAGSAAEPITEELAPAAEGPGYEVLSGPRGVADDLKKLHHISPAIEKKLNDLGIFHYWQLAGLSSEAARKIGEEVGLPGRMDGWIAQAKELAAEGTFGRVASCRGVQRARNAFRGGFRQSW